MPQCIQVCATSYYGRGNNKRHLTKLEMTEKRRQGQRPKFIIGMLKLSFKGTYLNCAFAFLDTFNALAFFFMWHLFILLNAPCRSISSTGNSRKLLRKKLARVDNLIPIRGYKCDNGAGPSWKWHVYVAGHACWMKNIRMCLFMENTSKQPSEKNLDVARCNFLFFVYLFWTLLCSEYCHLKTLTSNHLKKNKNSNFNLFQITKLCQNLACKGT